MLRVPSAVIPRACAVIQYARLIDSSSARLWDNGSPAPVHNCALGRAMMTTDACPPISRRRCARSFANRVAPKRGCRETGCFAAPASGLACGLHKKGAHAGIKVQRKHSGFPAGMAYGLYRAIPGETGFLPRHSQEALTPQELDATTAAVRTTRPHLRSSASSIALLRPPAPRPSSVTTADTPFCSRTGWADIVL